MTEIEFVGWLVGGLGAILSLFFLIDKLGEKDRKKLEIIAEENKVIAKENNDNNKELTKAINKLTNMVELTNNNMMNMQRVQETHSVEIEALKDNMRNAQFRCALEHKRKLEDME